MKRFIILYCMKSITNGNINLLFICNMNSIILDKKKYTPLLQMKLNDETLFPVSSLLPSVNCVGHELRKY
jgi:hypothetical protein